jgi:hypothetical protein
MLDVGFGVGSGRSLFVMLNLFQHPWPNLSVSVAPKETAGHGP